MGCGPGGCECNTSAVSSTALCRRGARAKRHTLSINTNGLATTLAAMSASAGVVYNEADDCWTFGGMDTLNPGFGPGLCCRPQPCGLKECWKPPEFTYHFCCQEPACRPSVVGDLQRALGVAVATLPNENASKVAFRAAPEAFRLLLRRGLRGLRLSLARGLQVAC